MDRLVSIADSYVDQTAIDYVGLWQIAGCVRDEFKLTSNDEVKRLSLEVVSLLLERGLRPGDYFKAGFKFWVQEGADEILFRIENEWDPVCGDPTLVEPICWFDRR